MSGPDAPLLLLLDDHPDSVEMWAELWRYEGFRVIPALDAEAALDAASTSRVHLIITDLNLAGTDGFEFIRRVRAGETERGPSSTPRDVLMVVVSSLVLLHDTGPLARKFGIDSWHMKPCSPEAITSDIRRLLRSAGLATED